MIRLQSNSFYPYIKKSAELDYQHSVESLFLFKGTRAMLGPSFSKRYNKLHVYGDLQL